MISSSFNQSSLLYSTKPFLISVANIDTDNRKRNGDHQTTSIFTYQEANDCMKKCRKWMIAQLEEAVTKICEPCFNHEIEIVVAFLSTNSPELVLAILAALDICALRDTSSSIKLITFRLAMLNARWTPQEIASVLQVSPSNSSHLHPTLSTIVQNKNSHITMLLYGDGFYGVAKEAVDTLINLDIKQNHKSFCAPIPGLSIVQNQCYTPANSKMINNFLSSWSDVEKNTHSWHADAIIIFTSGTTSTFIPKGVRLSYASLLVQSMAKLLPPCSYDYKTSLLGDTVPLYHVGGLSSMIAVIMAGGSIVYSKPQKKHLQPFSSFIPSNILRTIALSNDQDTANTLVVVPAMLHSFTEVSSTSLTSKYHNVRLIVIGGSNAPLELFHQAQDLFPYARIVQTYACSEAGSSITFLDVINNSKRISINNSRQKSLPGCCVGYPPPHIGIGILPQNINFELNSETSVAKIQHSWIAQPYEVGLICTRGLHVMNGYWRRCVSDNNNDRMHPFWGGWLITDDLGYLDENGGLYFCGRSSDVIRTGGETVFPMEVEQIISLYDGIDSCAVIGLPDHRFGEIVSAVVVPKKHELANNLSSFQVEHVRQHCKKYNLAGYKCPRAVFVVSEIPRNQSGKILRQKLVSKVLLLREDSKKGAHSKL
jgi:acyl-CoA synthetase (AMP-forming)/AMP-acid ligase II